MKITYFLKLLIILIIICLLSILYLKFRENFQITNNDTSIEVYKPTKINYNLSANNDKTQIILSWNKNINTTNYVIIMYINSDGPYFIDINEYYKNKNININDISKFEYVYNAQPNIIYRYAVICINNVNNKYLYSDYDIKEIQLSILDNNVKKVNSFDLRVSCNPNGDHVIGSKCVENSFPNLNSTIYNYDLNTTTNFDENEHNLLMDELTYNKKYSFNFN